MEDYNASAQRILEKAAGLVTPSIAEERRLEEVVAKVTRRIDDALDSEKASPRPQITLGGSYARGTWLKGSHDVDFFLLYPVDFPREKLESVAIRSASEALKGYPVNMRYAEHPYVEGFVDSIRINLVPCYAVAPGEWRSAADRSPYHTKYIASKLDDRLRLEARLFKKFVKASATYGAEVKIQGFSGYVCEVLTLKFGSFLDAVQGLSKIKPGEVLSLEPFDADLAASFKSPVVILDPVDTTRNLGSAISARNVAKLVLQSRGFVSRPGLTYFLPRKTARISATSRKSKQLQLLSRILILSFRNEPRSPDILWGELRRSSTSVSDKLCRMGFQVLRSSAASDEKKNSALLFVLASDKIENLILRHGPDYFRAEEVEKYYEKNRERALLTWIGNDGRLESVFEREAKLTKAQDALTWMLEKQNIDGIGLSARIRSEVIKGFRISTADRALKTKGTGEWLLREIAELSSND